jgi:hypothetical protein
VAARIPPFVGVEQAQQTGHISVTRRAKHARERYMSKGLATGLLVVGIIIIVLAVLEHFVFKINVMQHFSTIIGVVGLVVAAIGAWGFLRSGQSS